MGKIKPKFISQRLPTESTRTVWMTPKEFLDLAIPKKNGRFFESAYDKRSLKRLERRMLEHQEIDPPEFEVESTTGRVIDHSGRHRAFTAYKLGIKEIPVVIRYVGYERAPGMKIQKVDIPTYKIPTNMKLRPETKIRKYEIERLVK